MTLRKSILLIVSLCCIKFLDTGGDGSLTINSSCMVKKSRGAGNQVQRGKQKGEKVLEQRGLLHMNKTMRFIVSEGRHWIAPMSISPSFCMFFCSVEAEKGKHTFAKLTCCSKEHTKKIRCNIR